MFGVYPDKTATISGLTIRNGQAGIGNVGTLTVSNCVISGNSSGLSNVANGQTSTNATLTIANSIISDNSGPGICNFAFMASATVTILNSTLTRNVWRYHTLPALRAARKYHSSQQHNQR